MKITITIEMDEKEFKNIETKETEQKTEKTVSQYARFFDETCPSWSKNSEANLMFLKLQQQFANDMLKARGVLYLNEVYAMLGIPRTKAGQVVGWKYDLENPSGDNYVDFGIFDEKNKSFVNGFERSILLDFNVDGIII